MRGDSLRDLYAKALALLGLGLLGAAGALVDYWPVPSALPSVASVLVLPTGAGLPALHTTAPADISSATEIRSPKVASRAVAVTDVDLSLPDTSGNDAILSLPEGRTESLEPAVVLPSLDVSSATMTAMPVSAVALFPPVITAFEAIPENPLSPQPVPPAQNRDNRLTGAAKSGARAVAWTGKALAKPFVALGHVLNL